MKRNLFTLLVASLVCTTTIQAAEPTLKTIYIAPVTTNAALEIKTEKKGKALDIGQVVSGLQNRLNAAFTRTKKFNVIDDKSAGRMDERGQLQRNVPGVYDTKTVPKEGKFKAAGFAVLVEVDHFLDSAVEATFADGGRGYRRRMQVSGVVKITSTETLEQLDSSDIMSEVKDVITLPAGEVIEKERLEELLPGLLKDFSEKVVQATESSVYPMKVLDVTDGVVTINRNDRSGLQEGEVLTVLGPPKTFKDEDSGQMVKAPGAYLGKVKITLMTPQLSQAQILEEKEKGRITAGCFLARQNLQPSK